MQGIRQTVSEAYLPEIPYMDMLSMYSLIFFTLNNTRLLMRISAPASAPIFRAVACPHESMEESVLMSTAIGYSVSCLFGLFIKIPSFLTCPSYIVPFPCFVRLVQSGAHRVCTPGTAVLQALNAFLYFVHFSGVILTPESAWHGRCPVPDWVSCLSRLLEKSHFLL